MLSAKLRKKQVIEARVLARLAVVNKGKDRERKTTEHKH